MFKPKKAMPGACNFAADHAVARIAAVGLLLLRRQADPEVFAHGGEAPESPLEHLFKI